MCLDVLRSHIQRPSRSQNPKLVDWCLDEKLQDPAEIRAVSAIFALGLIVANNNSAMRQALSNGVMDIVSQILHECVDDGTLVLLLSVIQIFLEMPSHAVHNALVEAGGFEMLLGISRSTATLRCCQLSKRKAVHHLIRLSHVVASSTKSASAKYLQLGALPVVHGILERASLNNDILSLETCLACAQFLAVLCTDQDAACYIRSAILIEDVAVLCQKAADDSLINNPATAFVDTLMEMMLTAQDTTFVTRFLKASGCLSFGLQRPRIRKAAIRAAGYWPAQMRMTGGLTSSSPSSELGKAIALALLAPHDDRYAKALLTPGPLETLVSCLLTGAIGCTPAMQGDHKSSQQRQFKKFQMRKEKSRVCKERQANGKVDVARFSEVSQAIAAISTWMSSVAATDLNKEMIRRNCHRDLELVSPERCRDPQTDWPAKKPRLVATAELICFKVGSHSVLVDAEALRGASALLDGLMEMRRNEEPIAIPEIWGMPQTRIADCISWCADWLNCGCLTAPTLALSPRDALDLWKVADFLQVYELQQECQELVASGLSDSFLMRDVLAFAVLHLSNSHRQGSELYRLCMQFLASNVQTSISNGMMSILASQHYDNIHTGLVQELRGMIQYTMSRNEVSE